MKKLLKTEVNLENMTGKSRQNYKNYLKLKNNTKLQKIYYKITIFGAYAPYPRLIDILNYIVYLARKER